MVPVYDPMDVPDTINLPVDAVVGFAVVAQTNPLSVTAKPFSVMIFPPTNAVG